MKKVLIILSGFFLLSVLQVEAQDYSAVRYWNMEQDKTYINLVERQNKGELLTAEEQKSLDDYRMKLSEYFVRMPDNEKAIYYQNRVSWKENQQNMYSVPQPSTDVYAGERSKYTQYLITNGIFGAFYGGAAAFVWGVEDGGVATGLALLTAGGSVLLPVLSIKDKFVSYNSLSLSNHGKIIGAGQGAAFGLAMIGDNIDEGKLLISLSVLSSIALGRVGYSLGKNQPWSEGRVNLYSYYGTLMPLEGIAIAAAFESDNARIYGLSSLVFGAGGYLMADAIGKKIDVTRGDMTALTTLSLLNGGLGFSILGDIANNSSNSSSALILIPAAGALGASMMGHLWLKDAKFTNQQGRNVALATTGGTIIGLGLIALASPDNFTPYYITGYLTGMTTYALMVNAYKKNNNFSLPSRETKTGWNFSLTPHNIFINRKIAARILSNPGRRIDMLPAFSATLTF